VLLGAGYKYSYILVYYSLMCQVLDAVQFLHHRGVVHLSIQPDNVIMQSRRRFDVKLVDFGLAQKITTIDGVPVDRVGSAEFMGLCIASLPTCNNNNT